MDRSEHVQWVKDRALAELDAGDDRAIPNAIASVSSDLSKHPETEGHTAILLMFTLAMGGHLGTEREVREFIGAFGDRP